MKVIDDSNRDAFINNGYSAVCEFTYAPTLSNGQTLVPILAPSNIQAEGKGNRAGRLWWSAFAGATIDKPDRYKVEYKKVGVGLEWFSEFTTTDELVINQGLEPATTYEARVQGEKGGFLGDASSIVTFTTFTPVTPVCGVTPTNTLQNMTPMRNARIGMPIEVTGFEVVLDSLEAESTPGVYSGRGLIKIPFMLNQTFTVLFESLFINELGQAGEGKIWFKTKPIEEWIAENTPPISEQPISFMDFEPGTTVFPVVITGIVVLPNGQVTVVTPNGTFLADTTLIPRPVLKPTVLEDKNGNQFIVHPDGTVTALGQAGFIPKPMTTEEKLDKIRRGLYLEALKDYKTQIETYYTSKNEPIPTRGPRNHNKNIIIDLPECIGTETNEIKNNFLAIKDNVNKKELRENSLKRILGTSKKTTLDFIAQKALDSLMKMPKITATEFQKFLTNTQFKTEKDSVCGAWKGLFTNNFNNKLVVNFKTRAGYDGEFGFDDGHKYINQATGLKNDYLKFKVDTTNYYASNLFVLPNQQITLDVSVDPLYLKSVATDTNFVLRFVANNTNIQIQIDNAANLDFSNKNKNLKENYQIQIKALQTTTNNLYTNSDSVKIVDNKNKVLGRIRVFCKNIEEKKVIFIYVAHTRNAQGVPIYPNITENTMLNHLNNKSFNQGHTKWVKDTRTTIKSNGVDSPLVRQVDITNYIATNNITFNDDGMLFTKIIGGHSFATTGNEDVGIDFGTYDWRNSVANEDQIVFYFITDITLVGSTPTDFTSGATGINKNYCALFHFGDAKTVAHELGHGLGLEHSFLADTDYPNRIILKNATNNIMDYGNIPKKIFFLYQIKKINKN